MPLVTVSPIFLLTGLGMFFVFSLNFKVPFFGSEICKYHMSGLIMLQIMLKQFWRSS